MPIKKRIGDMILSLRKQSILSSLFITFTIAGFYPFAKLSTVTTFDRAMGQAMVNGIDVEKRVTSFYVWYLLFVPILFLIVCYLSSRIIRGADEKSPATKQALAFINTVSIVGLFPLFFTYVNLFASRNAFTLNLISIAFCFVLLALTYVFCLWHKNGGDFSPFKWVFITAFGLTLPFYMAVNQWKTLGSYKSVLVFVLIFGVLACAGMLLMSAFIKRKNYQTKDFTKLSLAFAPVMFGTAVVALLCESIHVLNQHGIFITGKEKLSLLVYAALAMMGVFVLIFHKYCDKIPPFRWEKVYYPALILSIICIQAMPPAQMLVSTDLFESANHGLMISEFFNFGKIPIVETFDAHMLSSSLFGILYGWLNADTFGALFVVYGSLIDIVTTLLFYKVVKEFFSDDFAFLLTLLFPLTHAFEYTSFGLLAILTLLYALKKNTYAGYFLHWISLVAVCLYKLDTGFSFGIACFAVWILLLFGKKHFNLALSFKKWILSFAITVGAALTGFVTLACLRGVNPLTRILEFLSLSKSNVNWALATVGNGNLVPTFFSYVFMPFVVMAILVILCKNAFQKKEQMNTNQFIICLVLLVNYLSNIQRGLVRHSVAELSLEDIFVFILSTSLLGICFFLSTLSKKNKELVFTAGMLFCLLFIPMLRTNESVHNTNLLTNGLATLSASETFQDLPKQKVARVELSAEMHERVDDVLAMIDTVIPADKTYLDFTNQSLLYALSGREKPVYVNQSPGLISDEKMQEKFIEEIEEAGDQVAFALMPVKDTPPLILKLDGIHNSYRYYKISEYISTHFVPLCSAGEFAIWCKKDQENAIKQELAGKGLSYIDYTYTTIKEHTYPLAGAAYQWGMLDSKKAYENKKIENVLSVEKDFYALDIAALNKDKGNYLLIEATSPKAGAATLCLGNHSKGTFEALNTFTFQIKEGSNRYLIRVSSDFYWYSGMIDAFTLESKTELLDQKIHLLEGD